MKWNVKHLRIAGLALLLTLAASSVGVAAEPAGQFTGSLVFTVTSFVTRQQFTLRVDRYSTAAERQRLADLLATKHYYGAGDELWQDSVGSLSIGGSTGQPVAAAFVQETATGRTLFAVMNRQLYVEQSTSHSQPDAISVVEINLDKNGRGEGTLIAAASLTFHGDTLEIKCREGQPYRLVGVRAAH